MRNRANDDGKVVGKSLTRVVLSICSRRFCATFSLLLVRSIAIQWQVNLYAERCRIMDTKIVLFLPADPKNNAMDMTPLLLLSVRRFVSFSLSVSRCFGFHHFDLFPFLLMAVIFVSGQTHFANGFLCETNDIALPSALLFLFGFSCAAVALVSVSIVAVVAVVLWPAKRCVRGVLSTAKNMGH